MFDGNRINDTDTPKVSILTKIHLHYDQTTFSTNNIILIINLCNFKSMDMEEGDTIEVFTQQSGGDLEETNENKHFVSSSYSKSTIFNKYLPTNNVIQQKQTQKHLIRSKYRQKKSDIIL